MKRTLLYLSCLLFIIGLSWLPGCIHPEKELPEVVVKKNILASILTLENYLKDSLLPAAEKADSPRVLQNPFIKTRSLYKSFEWAAEYFMPATTRFVNGAPLPETEVEENKIREPEGLQVLEGLLFPGTAPQNKAEIIRQIKLLQSNCIRYRDYFKAVDISPTQIFDAAKLQVFRVITLGISGFDAPLAQSSIPEASKSLQSIQAALAAFDSTAALSFYKTIHYLNEHPDFNSFDRLAFISSYANPLSRFITLRQQQLHIPVIMESRLLNPGAATLFDENAFNVNAYTPDSSYYITANKTALGKELFNNTLLSGNNSRSCASCHQPTRAFTDGLSRSATLDGKKLVRRNTPTLINAALQPSQFYDLRATVLENQAMDVITNHDEMHGSMQEAAAALWKDKKYRALFIKTFPDTISCITPIHIQHALASYIRSLVKLNSRFDEYMQGNTSALNKEEKAGFNLFMGKAKCGTCHFMPLFNGTVPPAFLKIETEVIGVPDASLKNIDTDQGRYDLSALEPFRNAFKTTTVRNSALTAPYMHNGVYNTLEQVVDFYNKGGGVGMGFKIDNQTLPFDKLDLTDDEQKSIVSFMKALNSK